MKKLVALFTLFLAFSANMNAQETQANDFRIKAKNDAIEVGKLLALEDQTVKDLYRLLVTKQEGLANDGFTAGEKAELLKSVEYKLKATFTPDQYAKLETNKELLNRLLN